MSNLRKAAEQALEALENAKSYDKEDLFGFDDEIAALRTALEAEQETTPKKGSYEAVFGHLGMTPDELGNYMITLQMLAEVIVANDVATRKQDEPVAFEFYNPATGHAIVDYSEHTHLGHLSREMGYISRPLVRAQQPLTEEQIFEIRAELNEQCALGESYIYLFDFEVIARAIERAHNIK